MFGSAGTFAFCSDSRWLPCLAAVAGLVGTVGCDFGRQGSLRVGIGVTRLASGHPVANAGVTCAPTRRVGPSTLYDLSAEQYLDGFSDISQVTDVSGRAVVPLHLFTLRGGLLVWLRLDPVELEDSVTGKTYFFRIEGEVRETLTVRMVAGESVKGEHFVLAINDIGPPIPE